MNDPRIGEVPHDFAGEISDWLIARDWLLDDNRVDPVDLAKLLTETRAFERRAIALEMKRLEDAATALALLLVRARMATPSSDRGCCETAYLEGMAAARTADVKGEANDDA